MYYFVEPMKEDDIPAVQQIEAQSFPILWSANTYRREIRDPQRCRYIVARASSTPPPPPKGGASAFTRNRHTGFLAGLLRSLRPRPATAPLPPPIVGYGGIWLTADEAHVTTIAVDPAHRRRGVGELLLNGLIDQAYELGARQMTLEVRVSNTPAQHLYLKYGFRPVGMRRRYYTNNGEDAMIMSTEDITDPAYRNRIGELRRRLYARLQAQAR